VRGVEDANELGNEGAGVPAIERGREMRKYKKKDSHAKDTHSLTRTRTHAHTHKYTHRIKQNGQRWKAN